MIHRKTYSHVGARLLFVLSSICFTFICFSQNNSSANQLLWKISGKGLKFPSYIFGTYHTNDPRVFVFSDSTYNALVQADAFVVEADIASLFSQIDTRKSSPQFTFDATGRPQILSYRSTKTGYGSEDGRPQFLDLYIQLLAYNLGKKCFMLESIEEQLQAYKTISKENSIQLGNVSDISEEKMLQIYLEGDIEKIRTVIEKNLQKTKDGYQWLINERNYVMADGIDTLCRKNKLFIAVGAAHLAGTTGIIQLLRDKGYKVQQVYATFSDKNSENRSKFLTRSHYLVRDSLLNFQISFGGKPVYEKSDIRQEYVYQEMGQGNTYILEIENAYKDHALKDYIHSIILSPDRARIDSVLLSNGSYAYQGLSKIYGVGYCWKRVFIHRGKLFKVSCYGGNKFMNSDRYLRFFDQMILF
jgi:uncharacterized protein YbaP (TraB family)